MEIRYLIDGISKLSDEVKVVAFNCSETIFFIAKNSHTLMAIPKELAPIQIHANSKDKPANIFAVLKGSHELTDVDYSLVDLVNTCH